MPKCDFCEKEVMLPFECKFCGGKFCIEHRLPENHSCSYAPPRTPLGRWEAKKAPTVKIEKVPLTPSTITEGKPRKKRNLKKIITIVAIIFLLLIALIYFIQYYQPPLTQQTSFDIHKEIQTLNNERPSWKQYGIENYDWKVWKKTAEAVDATFIEMDNWDDFKESLRQNEGFVSLLMLDEESRVIWFHILGVVVYLNY